MKWFISFFLILFCSSGCTPKIHTGMSRAEMTSVLERTFDLGMSEQEVVQGLHELGLEAQYDTKWDDLLHPDIAVLVRGKRKPFLMPYGYAMLGFTLNIQSSGLERIEYVALMPSRKQRDWWPWYPVVLMGETP